MSTVLLCLFIISSVIHLFFSWKDDARGRAFTKPVPLLLLIIYYVVSASSINIILLLALLTSWIGDILLIFKGHKWFYIGGISFTFTHIFFIVLFFKHIDPGMVNWIVVIPLAVIYFAVSLFIVHILKPSTPKMLIFPMYGYLLCNSTTNILALMQLFSLRNAAAAIAYAGAVLFFLSDCILYLVRYYPKEDLIYKRHFSVMLLYLSGEFLITYGVMML